MTDFATTWDDVAVVPSGVGLDRTLASVMEQCPSLMRYWCTVHGEIDPIASVKTKLVRKILGSVEGHRQLILDVCRRVEAMTTPARAYSTTLDVLAARSKHFQLDDYDFPGCMEWAQLAYLVRAADKSASIENYYEVCSDVLDSLERRFATGIPAATRAQHRLGRPVDPRDAIPPLWIHGAQVMVGAAALSLAGVK